MKRRDNRAIFKITIGSMLLMLMNAVVVIIIAFFLSNSMLTGVSADDLDDLVAHSISNIKVKDNAIHYGEGFSFVKNNVYMLVLEEDGMVVAGRYPVNSAVEIGPPIEGFRTVSLPPGDYYVVDQRIPGSRTQNSLWVRAVEAVSNAQNLGRFLIRLLLIIMPVFVILAAIISYFLAKKSFDRLNQAYNREKQFTSDISHELRTPLSVIAAQSEYLRDYCDDDNERQKGLELISEQVNKMSNMTEIMLALSRMESGSEKAKAEPLDFGTIVLKSISQITNLYPDMEIKSEIEEDICVYSNALLLSRAVDNILENAYKYGEKKAYITLVRKDNKAIFTCSDFGEGINEEDLPNIFSRFYRADSSRNPKEGTGLGLALVDRIMTGCNGKIWASNNPDKGASFYMELPIYTS